MSQIQDRSLFVDQIVEAMRPLLGFIENAKVREYGLAQASIIYDRLLPDRNLGNGVPHPGGVTQSLPFARKIRAGGNPLLFCLVACFGKG